MSSTLTLKDIFREFPNIELTCMSQPPKLNMAMAVYQLMDTNRVYVNHGGGESALFGSCIGFHHNFACCHLQDEKTGSQHEYKINK